ncbi:P-loop containing nucleoside triphosphate hydrolase protein [Leucogyrophana mollusca]|uniref:P-loop containing nucleoside triphosphate hydrolase protein n=1 Tax=Leucogyrophana mollusca TaxID=85980 RepID=A0ACB8BS39_9AGAM|nr:P-loop containing nucleoside triphosphate hydrolase protein [Leucogyrophana mollusca]
MKRLRLIITGDRGVGKTSLATRFCLCGFVPDYDNFLDETFRKLMIIDEECVSVEVLDGSDYEWGRNGPQTVRRLYIKEASCFFIVYSVACRSSFENVTAIYQEVFMAKDPELCPAIIVAAKCDLADSDHEVSTSEGQRLAEVLGCEFIETSAKEDHNVTEAFTSVIRLTTSRNPHWQVVHQSSLPHEHRCLGRCVVI